MMTALVARMIAVARVSRMRVGSTMLVTRLRVVRVMRIRDSRACMFILRRARERVYRRSHALERHGQQQEDQQESSEQFD